MQNKNLKKLFIDPSEESYEWESALFFNGKEDNHEEVSRLLSQAKEKYFDEDKINTAIEVFTQDMPETEKNRLLKGLKEIDWVENVEQKQNFLSIKTKKGPIYVWQINETLNGYENDKRLLTPDRKGNCHTDSIEMSKKYQKECYVVTGYIYTIADKAKYLHSWVEMEINNKIYVADYTMNALMNKEGYYLIKHAQELARMSNKQIIEDYKIINRLADNDLYFNVKEYTLFREEIMKDLSKNKKIINPEER